jgi:hypothetical protein
VLLWLALAYGTASLVHHLHNGIYLRAYPNLPASLSVARVFAAWFATAAVGALGYGVLRSGREIAGLLVLAVFAALGLLGLAHYALAPPSAHTLAMNASILVEVATAVLLLAAIMGRLLEVIRRRRGASGER